MASVVIRVAELPAAAACGLCAEPTEAEAGPRLFLADPPAPVCRRCGQHHAPSLVALVDLARSAQRVGRIGCHNGTVPLTALLQLAALAETYASHFTEGKRPAV